MWWNYRKPRPLKLGAFKFATKYDKPIIPVFVTMKDSQYYDDDGFNVQEYYVHFMPPIYPDKNLSKTENAKAMCEKNYNLWVKTYEDFYHEELRYNNEELSYN